MPESVRGSNFKGKVGAMFVDRGKKKHELRTRESKLQFRRMGTPALKQRSNPSETQLYFIYPKAEHY